MLLFQKKKSPLIMDSFKIKFQLCILAILLSATSLSANIFTNCDDLTISSSPEAETIKIIETLSKLTYIKRVGSDNLINTLICLIKDIDNNSVKIDALIIIAERHFEDSEFAQAKVIFENILAEEKEKASPAQISSAHNYMSLICKIEGKSLAAYKHNLAQLKLSNEYNLTSLSKIYLSLGEFHYHINDYAKAEKLYLEGIEVGDSISVGEVEYGWLLHRLGQVYRAQHRYKDAHFFTRQALMFWKKTNNDRAYCFSLVQYALLFHSENNNQKALKTIKEAYDLSKNTNLWLCHIEVLITLGKIHYKMGNISSSIQYLEEASTLSTEKSIPNYFEESYELLAKAYEASGQTTKANESYKNYFKEVQKSILQENIATKEWAKKNQDLLLSEQSLVELEEKEKLAYKKMALQKKLIFLGIIIILFISWLANRYFKANKEVLKQQKQLIKLNNTIQEQSRQLQEANEKISHKNDILELELVKKLLLLSKQGEAVQNMEKQLSNMRESPDNNVLRKQINSAKNDTSWEELDLQINQANSELFQTLSQRFENLSQNDLRLCAFLKMNMRTKEIASLTFKNPASVKVARSRLRKKLGLTHSSMTISTFLNRL